ncbi:hypothetical protein BD289DRAFT_429818 [Coniella lustricola]|uniref:Uncharacterized protein n=1 Tax=Coniella lustricola TaxID=2025994 RepID=A0A2T3ACS8_9PEZI|nr:hypothetical protein BD289DRAFT_429818 [Coniella lustricola]
MRIMDSNSSRSRHLKDSQKREQWFLGSFLVNNISNSPLQQLMKTFKAEGLCLPFGHFWLPVRPQGSGVPLPRPIVTTVRIASAITEQYMMHGTCTTTNGKSFQPLANKSGY